MNRKKVGFHIFILAILFTFGLNCYTTFDHPLVYLESDSSDYYETYQVTYLDDCSGCHEQENLITNDNYNYQDNTTYSYQWRYYFVQPWWVEPYYYEDHGGNTENREQLAQPGRRDFERGGVDGTRLGSTPQVNRPRLAKPSSDNDSGSSSVSSSSTPKRNERMEHVSTPSSNSGTSSSNTNTTSVSGSNNSTKKQSSPGPTRQTRTKKSEQKEK